LRTPGSAVGARLGLFIPHFRHTRCRTTLCCAVSSSALQEEVASAMHRLRTSYAVAQRPEPPATWLPRTDRSLSAHPRHRLWKF
jgi:hypothetical protein